MPDTEIDWRARFERAVSDNIEHAARQAAKLTEVQLELQQANQTIREQSALILRMTPAQNQVDAVIRERDVAFQRHAAERRSILQERDKWKAKALAGERAVIERAIASMQAYADTFPRETT